MRESGYYPPGAEFDPSAPWNDHDPDPVAFECKVTVIMNREVDVETKNYYQEPPEPWNGINAWNYDTSDVDWHEEYDEQYMSVPDLLTNMRTLLLKLDVTNLTSAERDMYDRVLEESQGWEEEDTEIEKL